MSDFVPAPPVAREYEHLKLLTIFHTILGILIIFTSSIFIIHTVFGLMMFLHPSSFGGPGKNQPPPSFGLIFFLIGGLVVLGGWSLGALTIYAGQCIRMRKKYTFIQVIEALLCFFVTPLGTALGIFTLLTLNQPTVKAMFGKYT
jgi:hypothetical protein